MLLPHALPIAVRVFRVIRVIRLIRLISVVVRVVMLTATCCAALVGGDFEHGLGSGRGGVALPLLNIKYRTMLTLKSHDLWLKRVENSNVQV